MSEAELKTLVEKNIKFTKNDEDDTWSGRFVYPSGSIYTVKDTPHTPMRAAKAEIKRRMIHVIISTAESRGEDLTVLQKISKKS